MEFEPVIGLEVHVELNTKSKIFCGCSTNFGDPPNSNTCPVCCGMPGVLPVLNSMVLEKAVRAGLALGGTAAEYSRFDRKQYFYPDLPKGYQISQLNYPIVKGGEIVIKTGTGEKKIRINRLHMEEDAGKLIHSEDESGRSFVDLNRAGVPLIEIVSEPDLASAREAFLYLTELKKIMKYVGVSDCNMEEGSLRCDANVSIRPKGSPTLGTKAEIKNMNSFKFVEKAIEHEISRQIGVVESGGRVVQETRLWDSAEGKTHSMRSKEEANDYRYFPEPDLTPLVIDKAWVDKIRAGLPELHMKLRERFMSEFGLPEYDADVLTADRCMAELFLATVKLHPRAKAVSNWMMGEVSKYLNDNGIEASELGLEPGRLAELLDAIEDGTISAKIAKDLFVETVKTGKSPRVLIGEKGLSQVSDSAEIGKVVDETIAENRDLVEKYRSGKTNVLGALVGQVMKKTRGKANPKVCNEILLKKLGPGTGA